MTLYRASAIEACLKGQLSNDPGVMLRALARVERWLRDLEQAAPE